jgi:membrane-associated phospholipid phosphatase
VHNPAATSVDRRRRVAEAGAAACALALAAVWLVALRTGAGRARDDALLHGMVGLARDRIYDRLQDVALLADPVPYAAAGLLCVAVALARRRPARAAAVAVVLVATGATTQALKHLLAQSRPVDWLGPRQIEDVSWPSGHGTAAMALALCAVVVAPPAWRALVGLLACGYAVAVAYATLALAWHYPSDVFGGFLVAGLWVTAALAVVARLEAGDPEPDPPPSLWWLVAPGLLGALAGAGLIAYASDPIGLDAADRATAVAGAFALAALALALVVLTVRAASDVDGPAAGSCRSARGVARRRVRTGA